jgi:hypothetical protein
MLPSINDQFPDPKYCLNCNQALYATGQAECTACGTAYDTNDPLTCRDTPLFLRWKFWFPGLCLSIASGVVSYAFCLTSGELGFALFVAVPISFGAILGYATRAHVWLLAMLGLVACGSVALALVGGGFAGFFCGITLGLIFIVPALLGIFSGLALRGFLKSSHWDQRWFLPLLFFLALPYVVQTVENQLPRRRQLVTVRTELSVHATPREAWQAVMFYEQVQHSPPWLLRLALPKPHRSEGDKTRVGEVVRCYYDRGYLAKRISRVQPQRRLEFEVVEQHLHFERDIRLLDGSFAIGQTSSGCTSILLTTRYERLLSPAVLWEPLERHVVHTLHEHVLEGMRRKAEGPQWREPSDRHRYRRESDAEAPTLVRYHRK